MESHFLVGGLTRRGILAAGLAAALAPRAVMADSAGVVHAIAEAARRLPASAPPAVAERIGWTLLDNLGAILHASSLPAALKTAGYFAGKTGDVAVLATGLTGVATQAAAASAYLIHAAEIDDSDMRGQIRASAVIMAACLAAAQASDVSGEAFIRAAALGYTLQGRFAAPVGPIQGEGWMASGVWGPPAAAAAVALLHDQSTNEIADAIAMAVSASGGVFQYYFDQTEEKRIIVARAARTAVESAGLAALGERGAAHAIEGKAGLYRLFARAAPPAASHFTDDLAALEGPLFVRPKFYAASHSIIPSLDGLAAVLPADFDAAAVERFIVRGDPAWGEVIGEKIDNFEAPETQLAAALNFSFVVSLWLLRGSVLPADYTAETLADPAILGLARAARFESAPGEPLSVELILKDGGSIRANAIDPPPDEPAPLEAEKRLAKFNALAGERLSPRRIEALRAHCFAVDEAGSMRAWAARAQSIMGLG